MTFGAGSRPWWTSPMRVPVTVMWRLYGPRWQQQGTLQFEFF